MYHFLCDYLYKDVNKDFDTSAIDSLVFSKIKSDLFPVLATKDKFDLEGKKQQAKEYIESLMKPTEAEMDYMERFIAKEYKPELLFEDTEIVERIRNHPMALWKCNDRRNVEVLVQNRELRCYQRFHFQYSCSYIGIGNISRNLYFIK